MVVDPLLGHLQEEVGHGQALLESGVADDLPDLALLALDEVVDEGKEAALNILQVGRDGGLHSVEVFLDARQDAAQRLVEHFELVYLPFINHLVLLTLLFVLDLLLLLQEVLDLLLAPEPLIFFCLPTHLHQVQGTRHTLHPAPLELLGAGCLVPAFFIGLDGIELGEGGVGFGFAEMGEVVFSFICSPVEVAREGGGAWLVRGFGAEADGLGATEEFLEGYGFDFSGEGFGGSFGSSHY